MVSKLSLSAVLLASTIVIGPVCAQNLAPPHAKPEPSILTDTPHFD